MLNQDRSISLRINAALVDEIKRFAEQYSVSSSYVYRAALKEFINNTVRNGRKGK